MDLNKNNISLNKTGKNFQIGWTNENEFSCSFFNKFICSTVRRNSSYYQLENIIFLNDYTFKNILNLPMKSASLKSYNEITMRKKYFTLKGKQVDNFYSFTTLIRIINCEIEHIISYEEEIGNRVNFKTKLLNGIFSLKNSNFLLQYKNFIVNFTERNIIYILEDIDFYFEGSLNDRLDVGVVAKNYLAHNFEFTMKFLSNLKNLSDIRCSFDLQINL